MRILKVLVIVSLVAFVAACTCRTREVGPGDNIPVAGEGSILKDVNFAFDRYDLDDTAQAMLQANYAWLSDHPEVAVQIEGHTDERGTAEYNMALGKRRAEAVRDYLSSLGLAADRMSTVSYGEELPLDPASNEAAWTKNRRAHSAIQ